MPKTKEKEFVYEMTQEEYDEGLAKGWDADDMLSVGKHTFRRSKWADKLKNSKKIKVSIYLDGDVVEHFRLRAEQPNAAEFGAQINQELRTAMERDLANEENRLDEVAEKLLSNPNFLQAISEKLKAA